MKPGNAVNGSTRFNELGRTLNGFAGVAANVTMIASLTIRMPKRIIKTAKPVSD